MRTLSLLAVRSSSSAGFARTMHARVFRLGDEVKLFHSFSAIGPFDVNIIKNILVR